ALGGDDRGIDVDVQLMASPKAAGRQLVHHDEALAEIDALATTGIAEDTLARWRERGKDGTRGHAAQGGDGPAGDQAAHRISRATGARRSGNRRGAGAGTAKPIALSTSATIVPRKRNPVICPAGSHWIGGWPRAAHRARVYRRGTHRS